VYFAAQICMLALNGDAGGLIDYRISMTGRVMQQ
jgi:hypothetical protein